VQELTTRPDGFTPLPSTPGGLALDYIRANLFDRTMLRAVPATAPGPTTTWPTRSTTSWRGPRPTRRRGSTPSASGGDPNRHPRQGVRFAPGNGIHDIHMNQGNTTTRPSSSGRRSSWRSSPRRGIPTTRPGTRSPAPTRATRRRRTTPSGSSPRWSTRSARHQRPRPSPWSTPAEFYITYFAPTATPLLIDVPEVPPRCPDA
jgi:Uncharacterized conserved protein (DUF2278)